MNYLFYLGIIVPTLITICLFLIFIYCWFLQKARKEVLTRRYDPHGKMRRLGIPMEPPPPPDYCRTETTPIASASTSHLSASLAARLGEENMAYSVSRSPSTEQQQQQQHSNRRSQLYHTYHDSGISAGGLAAMSEGDVHCEAGNQEGGNHRIRQSAACGSGLVYRTCPDSGISGLSLSAGPGASSPTAPALVGAGLCPSLDYHQHYHQAAYHEDNYAQQQPAAQHQQLQQPQRCSLYQPQQHHHNRPSFLHHTLTQATVHPSHGVCYGDNTNHPQSPQHYTPPPQHHSRLVRGQLQQRQHQLMRGAPSDQCTSPNAPPPPCCIHGRCNAAGGQGAGQIALELVSSPSFSSTNPKDLFTQEECATTETSFGPQGAMDVMVTPCGDPRIVNTSLPAEQTIVLSCLLQQSQQQQDINPHTPRLHHDCNHQELSSYQKQQQSYQQENQQPQRVPPKHSNIAALPSSSSPMTCRARIQHRDSGITEDSSGSIDQCAGCSSTSSAGSSNNTSVSRERPDSQASHSPSTTDSEDSGFRGSHGGPAGQAQPVPVASNSSNRLNKQANPLLKPLRRPRTKTARKSGAFVSSTSGSASGTIPKSSPIQREETTVANTDSSAPGSPTPLLTLDPHNLTPPPLANVADVGRGLEMLDMAGRGEPAFQRSLGSSSSSSPGQPDAPQWSDEPPSSRKDKRGDPSGNSGNLSADGGRGDISTHLSWSYLEGLSHSPVGGASNQVGMADSGIEPGQLRKDLHHMDLLGYSVV